MNIVNYPKQIKNLCSICHKLGANGLCRATSGNFSSRIDEKKFIITKSGCDKATLKTNDLMIYDVHGNSENNTFNPSAESALHCTLYLLDPAIKAILHTHSIAATVVSRISSSSIKLEGYEMQKAIDNCYSHDCEIDIKIFENSQDMNKLSQELKIAWENNELTSSCFLIKGHGLYAWGKSLDEAYRHIDGIEFLLECFWNEILVTSL